MWVSGQGGVRKCGLTLEEEEKASWKYSKKQREQNMEETLTTGLKKTTPLVSGQSFHGKDLHANLGSCNPTMGGRRQTKLNYRKFMQ